MPAKFDPVPAPVTGGLQAAVADRPQLQFGVLGDYLANDYGGGGESTALTGFALYANPAHHWGLEAEVTATVRSPRQQHEVIGAIGPRVSFQVARVTGSLRAQVGAASFSHPKVLPSQESSFYLAVGGGGAIDVRLTRLVNWRAVDAQYTILPGFQPNRLTPWSIGSGFAFVYGRTH